MNHDYFNDIPLSEVIARMVDDSGRPLKAIAAEIGKGYSTLYRELDSNDEGAKIGVDSLQPIIRACIRHPLVSPPPPLMWLNSKNGFKAVPLTASPDRDDIRDELLDVHTAINAVNDAREKGIGPEGMLALVREAQFQLDQFAEKYRQEYGRKAQ